jgi:hypothetical protein
MSSIPLVVSFEHVWENLSFCAVQAVFWDTYHKTERDDGTEHGVSFAMYKAVYCRYSKALLGDVK